jgi:ABC-2 type transport system ATP-binding protein
VATDERAVEVAGLRQVFGTFTVLKDVTFHLRKGEIYGLIGPNGCGKTTTINAISGLTAPTAGKVRVFGHDPRREATAVHRLLGVVPQETSLYEELSAERNLRFHAELYGVPSSEVQGRVDAMLALAQLTERRRSRVGTFSGGMKRRLAIARALLHDPQLVYLDEPTLGVDVQARHVIWDYIRAMRAEGRTVLITTNYLDEGDALCDRMGVLDSGRLVAEGSPTDLKRRYGSQVVEIRPDAPPSPELLDELRALPGVSEVRQEEDAVRLGLGGERQDEAMPRLLELFSRHGVQLRGLQLREPTLDEVFLRLTGAGVRD